MIKKIYFVLALCFFYMLSVHAEDSILKVDSMLGYTEETVDISICLSTNPGIAAFDFSLSFDNTLIEPIAIEDGIVSNVVSNIHAQEGTDLNFVSAVWASDNNVNDNGVLFTIKFKMNKAANKNAEIKIMGHMCNQYMEDIYVEPINKDIEITQTSNSLSGKINSQFSYGYLNNTSKQEVKIFTSEELKDYINEYYHPYNFDEFYMEKYDEDFFKDHFLYLHHIDDDSSGSKYKINFVGQTENVVEATIVKTFPGYTDDMVSWFLMLEVPYEFSDNDFLINFNVYEYPYTIDSLRIISENGIEYNTVPLDKDFVLDMSITKNENRNSKDSFLIAIYDENNTLIRMKHIKANSITSTKFSCSVNIQKSDTRIRQIKVFVWNSLGEMTPLSKVKNIYMR